VQGVLKGNQSGLLKEVQAHFICLKPTFKAIKGMVASINASLGIGQPCGQVSETVIEHLDQGGNWSARDEEKTTGNSATTFSLRESAKEIINGSSGYRGVEKIQHRSVDVSPG